MSIRHSTPVHETFDKVRLLVGIFDDDPMQVWDSNERVAKPSTEKCIIKRDETSLRVETTMNLIIDVVEAAHSIAHVRDSLQRTDKL